MKATASPVEPSKVRLTVEVGAEEVEAALDEAVKTIGRQVRVKGFRPGKVPRKVLEAQLGGPGALRAEALRSSLPDFYAAAVVEADLDPIDSPEIDITAGELEGAVTFDALVEVRPEVDLVGYEGLEVTVPGLAVGDEEIEAQLDRQRSADGVLVDVERAVAAKDYATLDLEGLDAEGKTVAKAEDFVYEVGSKSVPGLDEAVTGAELGAELSWTAEVQGTGEVAFTATVKALRERQLPDLTDAWVAENSEFTTVADLRADIADRMGKVKVIQAQMSLRDATGAALADLVDLEQVPAVLVDRETQERLHELGHRLEHQGLELEQFLQATGQSPDELVAAMRADAQRAVRVDLALRAVARLEGLAPDGDALRAELERSAERLDTDAETLAAQLEASGRSGAFKAELAKTKALDWVIERATIKDPEGATIDREALKANQAEEE